MSSFIRPELAHWAQRHRDVLGALAILAVGVVLLLRGAFGSGPFVLGLGALLVVMSVPFIRSAVLRLRLTRLEPAPGIMLLDERRVGFFGPESGGFLEADQLAAVDLIVSPPSEPAWRITGEDGQLLTIPVSAEGADRVQDIFGTLPGFRLGPALDLLESGRAGHHPIWRRAPLPEGSRLTRR